MVRSRRLMVHFKKQAIGCNFRDRSKLAVNSKKEAIVCQSEERVNHNFSESY